VGEGGRWEIWWMAIGGSLLEKNFAGVFELNAKCCLRACSGAF
jgi:hypothetical protein